MSVPQLIIDGVPVPWACLGEYSQRYEWLRGGGSVRAWRGSLVVQRRWKKLRTVIGASGWVPPSLMDIEDTDFVNIKCPSPLRASGPTNILTLRAARRTDTQEAGFAVLPDGREISSPVSLVGDTATVEEVSGATGYHVLYYPEFTASLLLTSDSQTYSGSFGWELTAEEV